MRAIVIGGDGMLGSALVTHLRGLGHEAVPTSRHLTSSKHEGAVKFDMLHPKLPLSGEKDLKHVVYVVAAVTGFGRCEHDPDTWRVNADAPVALALQAHERGWPVIFISSDAVEFAPGTNYARQKAYAESVVLSLGGCIVRPARIRPHRLTDLLDLLARVGTGKTRGLLRWEG